MTLIKIIRPRMIAFLQPVLYACGPALVFTETHTHILNTCTETTSSKVHFLSKISERFFFSWLTSIKINTLDENKEQYVFF